MSGKRTSKDHWTLASFFKSFIVSSCLVVFAFHLVMLTLAKVYSEGKFSLDSFKKLIFSLKESQSLKYDM